MTDKQHKIHINIYEIQDMAEKISRMLSIPFDEVLTIYLDLLEDTSLPLDLNELVNKCTNNGYSVTTCGYIVSAIAGYILSKCIIERNCKVIVQPSG